MKDKIWNDCDFDYSGLAMTGGYWRPHQERRPYKQGSPQAFGVAEDPFIIVSKDMAVLPA